MAVLLWPVKAIFGVVLRNILQPQSCSVSLSSKQFELLLLGLRFWINWMLNENKDLNDSNSS